MAKKARVWTGTEFVELASAQTDLTAYSTTAQMNTAIAAASGLTLIKTQVIGSAVASFTVSDVFSSTYDNYKITYTGGASSDSGPDTYMTLGSANTNYYSVRSGYRYAASALDFADANNGVKWLVGGGASNQIALNLDVLAPNLAVNTYFNGSHNAAAGIAITAGRQESATQFTAFTVTPSGGTFTGGTVRVYGYQNS